MKILLDSDVIIECLRGNSIIVNRFKEWSLTRSVIISYTPISTAEIYAGVRNKERSRVKYFFDNLNLIPIDDGIGRKAGNYLKQFSKSHSVEIADAMIAAAAFVKQSKLFTHNKKHYPMTDIEFI